MMNYKIFITLVVTILIQESFSKPIADDGITSSEEEAEMRKNPTPDQELVLYVYDNFLDALMVCTSNYANLSRTMLNDESLIANHGPEVVEFKTNLTNFLSKYEKENVPASAWHLVNVYENITNHYLELPESKQTADSRIIINLLNKYNAYNVPDEFLQKLENFINGFKQLYDENRMQLSEITLQWYEKFKTFTRLDKQIESIKEFLLLF